MDRGRPNVNRSGGDRCCLFFIPRLGARRNDVQFSSSAERGDQSLSIRDFRGVEKLDLDFRGPDGHPNSLVVLAGPNGCGKTAVLEAALLVVGGDDILVGRQDQRRFGEEPPTIRLRLTIKSGATRSPTDINAQATAAITNANTALVLFVMASAPTPGAG